MHLFLSLLIVHLSTFSCVHLSTFSCLENPALYQNHKAINLHFSSTVSELLTKYLK
jgi:hypothetical protein